MTAPDTPLVVDIHLAAFPGFFLSFLGSRFLHLFYMEAVALGELIYVADDGSVLGLHHGKCGVARGTFFRRLLRR